jgi:hypothetical protein
MSVLTHVELVWVKKRIENRIRLGRITEQHVIDRQRRVVSFTAGSIFAFVRWTANGYGTVLSRTTFRVRSRGASATRRCRVRAPAARVYCASPGGRRSRRCCRKSMPSCSASIRPMPRRTTRSTSITACPSASSRDRTRRAGIKPGCIGGD